MRTVTVAELGDIFDGPHATPTRIDSGPYFLNIAALKDGALDLAECDHVSEDDYVKWTKRVTPQGGDLLFSYETRLGESALMPHGVRACLGRRMALIRPDLNIIDPRYLSYLYASSRFQETIRLNTIHGATVDRIPISSMGSWEVEIHDFHEQETIAEILGALDDKIAANEHSVDLMDSLVRTEYESMRSSATKSIPLNKIAANTRTTVAPGEAQFGLYLGLEHLPRRRMWTSNFGSATEVTSAKSAFGAGDVLFGKLRPYFHKVVMSPGDGVCSTDILVLRSTNSLQGLVLAAVASDSAIELANSASAGTKMPRASWKDLSTLDVPWPGDTEARNFSLRIEELSDLAQGLIEESRLLAALRDALLPELMSGQLRVKDAEKTVEEVL